MPLKEIKYYLLRLVLGTAIISGVIGVLSLFVNSDDWHLVKILLTTFTITTAGVIGLVNSFQFKDGEHKGYFWLGGIAIITAGIASLQSFAMIWDVEFIRFSESFFKSWQSFLVAAGGSTLLGLLMLGRFAVVPKFLIHSAKVLIPLLTTGLIAIILFSDGSGNVIVFKTITTLSILVVLNTILVPVYLFRSWTNESDHIKRLGLTLFEGLVDLVAVVGIFIVLSENYKLISAELGSTTGVLFIASIFVMVNSIHLKKTELKLKALSVVGLVASVLTTLFYLNLIWDVVSLASEEWKLAIDGSIVSFTTAVLSLISLAKLKPKYELARATAWYSSLVFALYMMSWITFEIDFSNQLLIVTFFGIIWTVSAIALWVFHMLSKDDMQKIKTAKIQKALTEE